MHLCSPWCPFRRNTDTRKNGQGSTTNGFEFSSDSSEVVDETLGFTLDYYTVVTALELQFPAGDTYKFDVWLYDQEGEPLYSQVVRAPLALILPVVTPGRVHVTPRGTRVGAEAGQLGFTTVAANSKL